MPPQFFEYRTGATVAERSRQLLSLRVIRPTFDVDLQLTSHEGIRTRKSRPGETFERDGQLRGQSNRDSKEAQCDGKPDWHSDDVRVSPNRPCDTGESV